MSVDEVHNKFGHSNGNSTCKIAADLGIELTQGLMKVCKACTMAKAKQKNAPKEGALMNLQQAMVTEYFWT
jgi:hypothetical protein